MYLTYDEMLLILEMLSASEINKFCKINKDFNRFCKDDQNKGYLSKIILKNDYKFKYFPREFNYPPILRFLKKINYNENKNINNALLQTIELAPTNSKLQIIKFLIKNGANNINQALNIALNIVFDDEIINYLEKRLKKQLDNNQIGSGKRKSKEKKIKKFNQKGGNYYDDYEDLKERIHYVKNNKPFTSEMISNAMIKYKELYDNVTDSSDYIYLKDLIKKVLKNENKQEIIEQIKIIDKEINKLLDFAFMQEDFDKFNF